MHYLLIIHSHFPFSILKTQFLCAVVLVTSTSTLPWRQSWLSSDTQLFTSSWIKVCRYGKLGTMTQSCFDPSTAPIVFDEWLLEFKHTVSTAASVWPIHLRLENQEFLIFFSYNSILHQQISPTLLLPLHHLLWSDRFIKKKLRSGRVKSQQYCKTTIKLSC